MSAVVEGQLGDRAIVQVGRGTVYVAAEAAGASSAAMLSPNGAREFARAVLAAADECDALRVPAREDGET